MNETSFFASSTVFGELLARALARLAVGATPSEVVEFLRGGTIVAVEKNDGGIRPLTMSNVIRRVSLKALLEQHKEEMTRAVGDL